MRSSGWWHGLVWGAALTSGLFSIAKDGQQARVTLKSDGYHVYPDDDIQDALQAAALNPTNKVVQVHAGIYRPKSKRQALLWLNRQHDGIQLQSEGEVTLTAANPEISSFENPSHPAIVNHVVYIGEGVSSNTVIQGFRITGANHFVTDKLTKQIEPDSTVAKNLFFYTDGGAVKIFGHSAPILRNLLVENNYASPCAGGISIQQEGFNHNAVLIENCIFLNNRAQVTGAAVDLLEGSAACLVNCLFVGNVSNTGVDIVALRAQETPFTNSGVLTVFKHSRAWVRNCTFTGNRNGVDDMGGESCYSGCVFFHNTLEAGLPGAKRYEMDLPAGGRVSGCFIAGAWNDPHNILSADGNTLGAPDPRFTSTFVPEAPIYRNAGYHPTGAWPAIRLPQ